MILARCLKGGWLLTLGCHRLLDVRRINWKIISKCSCVLCVRALHNIFLFFYSFVCTEVKIWQCHVSPLLPHAWLRQSKPTSRGLVRGYGWSTRHTARRSFGAIVNQSMRWRRSSIVSWLGQDIRIFLAKRLLSRREVGRERGKRVDCWNNFLKTSSLVVTVELVQPMLAFCAVRCWGNSPLV